MQKGELLFESKEKTTSATLREFTPQGARIDFNLAGQVSGRLNGLQMSTHNVLLKADGTAEGDARSLIFAAGEPVFHWGKVKARLVDPTPMSRVEVELTFQTPSQKLAWLNTTKGWLEGLENFATGEFSSKVYTQK